MLLTKLKKTGATEIVAIVGHGAEMVQNHLGDRVSYAVQAEQLGQDMRCYKQNPF